MGRVVEGTLLDGSGPKPSDSCDLVSEVYMRECSAKKKRDLEEAKELWVMTTIAYYDYHSFWLSQIMITSMYNNNVLLGV